LDVLVTTGSRWTGRLDAPRHEVGIWIAGVGPQGVYDELHARAARQVPGHRRGREEGVMEGPLSAAELNAIDACWRAANYLSVGQIYLLANPLLREPLQVSHIKPRLLGHWARPRD
jgi:hypothetical protein